MSTGSNSEAALRRYIDRLEKLHGDKQEVADEIKDVFNEARLEGFDARAIREILRMRRMDPEKRRLLEFNVETYRAALGELSSLPLGEAAVERAAAAH